MSRSLKAFVLGLPSVFALFLLWLLHNAVVESEMQLKACKVIVKFYQEALEVQPTGATEL